METELIGFIAQLITGIATLLVALVLVFQLRKQNQQLAIQHKDFTQQIKNQIMDREILLIGNQEVRRIFPILAFRWIFLLKIDPTMHY